MSGPPFFAMPLNEAESFRHSNLTEKQQHDAIQAIYGVERDPMTPEALTYEERVKMRRMLDQMDQKEASGAMKDFDLNKPPVPPYQYREFPFLMYNHEEKRTKAARDHVERERMIAEGWSESPLPPEPPPEIQLTAAEHAEVEETDKQLAKKRRP